jgi:chemotaxis-related protein WspD
MCISLGDLLGLSSQERNLSSLPPTGFTRYQRMLVLEIQDNRWVFPVDEISGVYRFSQQDLQDTPVVVTKIPDTYTKKIISWQDKRINYLDYELLFYELLFYTLNRS